MAYTTIDDPTIFFNTVLYTGNATGRSITGVGFQPDFVWNKTRSAGQNHFLYDSVRGAQKDLRSNQDGAEGTSDAVTAFNSDGFSVGSGNDGNENSQTYVNWNWKAGGSASSNSNGSITSSVSANTTAGFSIVSYTGTGATATIGHGLGSAPKMVIVKQRNTQRNWVAMHQGIGFTKYLYLDSTQASNTGNFFNDTDPSSTVFNVVNDGGVNASGGSYIAYCFAEKKGYSKISGFTGNGNADGTFVYTGFAPAFVLLKNADEVEQWWIFDNKRNAHAGNFRYYSLNPNASSAEGTTSGDNNHIDFYSNGFKLRTTAQQLNGTSDNFIYMAFAESPFVNSNGVPTNAK